MSKKAAKRTKAAKELPRVSPHWWTEKRAVLYCRERKGDQHIGDFALCEAFNQKQKGSFNQKGLPVKIEWIDQQTNPPSLAWKLLSSQDYEARPGMPWETKLWFSPRRLDIPWPEGVVFFWGPTVEQLLPAEEAEPETKAQHRQKPGTKAIGNWPDLLTRELIRVAFEEPELIRDRDKLVGHLRKTLKAEIKGWDLSQNKAIHQTLNYLLNRITSLGSNSP